jgi:hypothetical protein
MPRMLSDLVDTAVGFRAAVNIVQEQDDLEKASVFLPTRKAAEVIFDLGRQLEPRAKERARLITGSYGRGKSHLALVLASLYRGHQDALNPLMARLRAKNPGRWGQLQQELAAITPEKPFLVVIIEGDQDGFDAALIRGLRSALDRCGLREFMPKTYFSAAADRLQELLDDADAKRRIAEAARELGLGSPQDLLFRLSGEAAEMKDLDAFRQLHEKVCFGAPFAPEQRMEAGLTYKEAAHQLVGEGRFGGIAVIWDEFGSFMDQIIRDPGTQGASVQRFAEACQDSGADQLHLYLVAHRSLESYVRRARDTMHLTASMRDAWEQDFKKVSGRFKEFVMESEAEELFTLVDDVLIQRRGDGWDDFARQRDGDFSIETDRAFKASLFPDLSSAKLRTIVVEGCYPLSPVTTALLPRVAETVAQNQRTLFTFLCADHPGTVAHYLRETPCPDAGAPLPFVGCDALWDYFEHAIRDDKYGQPVYRRYRTALATAPNLFEDQAARRLLKALALFDLVREADQHGAAELPANEGMLELALNVNSDADRETLRERLQEMSRPGPNRVAVRGRDGIYRLVSGSGTELADAVEQTLEQRRASFSAAQSLRSSWGKGTGSDGKMRLGFETCFEALTLQQDVVSRTIEVVVLFPEETENLRPWTKDIGAGEFKDGLLFLVIPDEDAHIGVISKRALEYADNPQILFARPPAAIRGVREVLARIDALESVAANDPGLWGPKGERRDEWDAEYEQAKDKLSELLAPVGLRHSGHGMNLECVWRGSLRPCRSWTEVVALADEAMGHAFSLTPKTPDGMMNSGGRDGLAPARRAVIDTLIDPRGGPAALLTLKDQSQLRIVRMLETIGVLAGQPRPALARPDENQDPGAAAVWDHLLKVREQVVEAPQPLSTVEKVLRGAPYGIGRRVLPLLLVAALREDVRAGNLTLERLGRRQEWQTLAIDGKSLDEAFADPGDYRLRYVDVTEQQFFAVEGLIAAVAGEDAVPRSRAQLLDEAKRQVALWWSRLPRYCQQTSQLTSATLRLRDDVLRPLIHPDADAHRILVEELRQRMGDVSKMDRQAFRDRFLELVQEISGAVAGLSARVAESLRDGLGLDCEATPSGVVHGLEDWYRALPADVRDYCHGHDAGKLQSWLRSGPTPALEQLCETMMGRSLPDWDDADVLIFVGRVQSAREAISTWVAPPPPPTPSKPPALQPGTATLSITAHYPDGDAVALTRFFPAIPADALSDDARMLLRFLTTNLVETYALRDGERENLLVELARRVFGDG